jgi:hypothetical protein
MSTASKALAGMVFSSAMNGSGQELEAAPPKNQFEPLSASTSP